MAEAGCLKVWLDRDGALLRLRLARPKANICDAAMIAALQAALDAHRGQRGLRGVLLDGEGPHFSFGASVEEHLADRCAGMLASLHALILTMAGYPVPILVAVRGQCLGGGLEIALAGGPIFAHPDWAYIVRTGQPYPWCGFDRKYVIRPPLDYGHAYPLGLADPKWATDW